ALKGFPGTILFVSHDRYFINKIADTVIELTPEGLTSYLGDFDYYIEKKVEEKEIEEIEEKIKHEKKEKTTQLSFEEQKRRQSEERRKAREVEALERKIEENEAKIEKLERQMTDEDILQDHEQLLE